MGVLKTTLKKLQRTALSPAQQEKLGVLATRNPEFGDAAKYMLPDEVVSSTRGDNPEKIVALLRSMSTYQQLAAGAKSAAGKRGWYRASADALHEVFGDDTPRFASLLAALSPQTSVETNMTHALKIWNKWVDAGRPQDPKQISAIMGGEVQGARGEESVLNAWKNNSIRALTMKIPVGDRKFRVPMSGPKVNSFTANLLGDVYEVTNDAWQSKLLFGHGKQIDDHYRALGLDVKPKKDEWVPQKLYALTTDDPQPGPIPKPPGYIASNVLTRQAADSIGMTPEQMQASAWTFGKNVTETAERLGIPEREVLQRGLVTPEMLNASSDFSTMMTDPKYLGLLSSKHPDIQRAAERASALQPAPLAEPIPLTLTDENRQLQLAKQLERARGLTKAVAPVATTGALSAAALSPEDAEAGNAKQFGKIFSVLDGSAIGAVPNQIDAITKPGWRMSKKATGEVVYMSPDEYLSAAASLLSKGGRAPLTVEDVVRGRNAEDVSAMADAMRAGKVFASPWLDYRPDKLGQEGIHRALAAKQLGLEKIPVTTIRPFDSDELWLKQDPNALSGIPAFSEDPVGRGITKAVAPVAATGALSAAALGTEDAEAGLTSRLPKWMGEAEMRRWANAREDAAAALAKGGDLDKVFRETGWAPDYNSGEPLQWDVQLKNLVRQGELSGPRAGARDSVQKLIEPLLVREFDTFGSRVPTMSDVPPHADDDVTNSLAQHIFLRGAPKRGPNAPQNLYRDVLGARPLGELLGKDAGLFREYPEALKASYTGQGGIGAAVYHAEAKDPAKLLFTFGESDPRIIPPWETDPLRSFIEHEGGYHVPQGIDDRMRGRRNLFDYINDPTEVSARAGQARLHPTVRAMESPRSTMDRYARSAKGGEHHPQETYPTQGKLFGGAAGTSLVGAGTAAGILAAPTDANAGARSTTTPGILDSALSMLAGAGGVTPDTAAGHFAEQRDQLYDFIVGAPAQFVGSAVDTGQAFGAGLWQQAAMSDPEFQRRSLGNAGSVFENEGMLPADRNPIWNAENLPGGTDWNMRKLGANPQSGGAFMGMAAGGVLTPSNWVGRVKQAGQYLGDVPWISKIIDKTIDAPVFRKPVKRLDEVNITDEHVPGVFGHMDDMKGQPEKVRNYYSMAGRSLEHRGRNPFYADQQQFGVDRVSGDYTNSTGVREHNPGYRTMLDSTTPEALIAPRQHLRALVDAQEASAGHRINTDVLPSQIDSARLDVGDHIDPDARAVLRERLEALGLATIDTGNGVTTLRGPFDRDLSPRRVRGILSDITHSDIGVPRGTLTEGKFESVFETPAWNKQQGTGQAVDNWLANTADADYAGIDTQHLRDYVLGKRKLDDNFSSLLNMQQREDIRKMRAMIGSMGIQGFRDFVRKNGSQGLPVALLGGYLMQQNEQPQSALMENRT